MNEKGKSIIATLLPLVGSIIVIAAYGKTSTKKTLMFASEALCIEIVAFALGFLKGLLSGVAVIYYLLGTVSFVLWILELILFIKACKDDSNPEIPLIAPMAKPFSLGLLLMA